MADEKYRLTLEGSEIDEALLRLANYEDEGLVLGSRKGVMLGSESEYYHKNARYYAELAQSAVPGDTTSAVRWDIDQSALTDADRELARKNIRAGGSNWNFLDNSWFTVNQRSFTSTSSAAYFADRWQVSGNTYTLTRRTTGITIQVDSGVGYLFQKMESAIYDFLDGKTVTYSFRFSDDTVISRTFVWDKTKRNYPIEIPNDTRFQFWYGDAGQPCLRIFASSTGYDIDAIKLELGSVSTLANDAPPNYAEELAKCQRYFLRLKATGYNYIPIASGVWTSVSTVRMLINTPVPMRAVPTISRSGTFKCAGNGTILDVSALGALTITEQGVFANVLTNGSPVTWQYYTLLMLENAYIDLSADL